ncbi:unnamed protein product [Ectocarpus fasciculatus]
MGNQGSFMEKVYVYLPVLMCHSKMDYSDQGTMWNIRAAYFAEQIGLFAFTAYFVFAIRRRRDHRRIFVPDITQGHVLANNVPGPDQLMYRSTSYFQHEMTEVFHELQQQFVALMLTILAHFVLGFRPILLLQIFSAPYHFSENRLLRKFVLGLKPGYRVWGERFEGELEGSKIKEGEKAAPTAAAAAEGEGEGAGAIPGLGSSSDAATSAVKVEAEPAVTVTAAVAGEDDGSNSLPMPRELEDKLIDAWEAAGEGDFGAVMEQLGPFTVNTRTPALGWSPLMVACGLSQVGEGDIKAMVEDLDAQVDLQDQDGWTCLHWAAQQGRVDAARAVFEALGSIASEPSAAATMIQDLRAMGDAEGKTAADVAREAGLASSVLEGFLGVLEEGAR